MDSSDVPVIETSQWPLPRDGRRIVVPQALIQTLGAHPLCGDCLPHGVGYYPRAAGHQMGRASPRDHLLIYCVAGRGEVDLDGDAHPVGPGDVLGMAWCWAAVLSGGSPAVVGVAARARPEERRAPAEEERSGGERR